MTTDETYNQSLSSAQDWIERLTVTIDTPKKQSKLLCSLEQSIENGVEAYNNEDYKAAQSALETASVLADSLIEKEWTNTEDEEKIASHVIPAIKEALSEIKQKPQIAN